MAEIIIQVGYIPYLSAHIYFSSAQFCLVCSSASQNSVIQQPNDSFYLRAKYVLLLRLLLRLRPSILFLCPIILYFRAKYSVLPRQIFCSSAPISLFFRAK
jgi:hypothetical protein